LADANRTPMFSSSALRFAKELGEVNRDTASLVTAIGPGRYDNYAVHLFELIVTVLGTGAADIKSLSTPQGRLLVTRYADERQSVMLQLPNAPFQLSIALRDGSGVHIPQCSDI